MARRDLGSGLWARVGDRLRQHIPECEREEKFSLWRGASTGPVRRGRGRRNYDLVRLLTGDKHLIIEALTAIGPMPTRPCPFFLHLKL